MSFFLNPAIACDYYKAGHPWMQPTGMETVYATWTARSFKHHKDCPKTAVFGHQYTIREWFIDFFNENFFKQPIEDLEKEFNEMMTESFNPRYADFSKFKALHELGYLPIAIYGVPEGTLLPIGIPDHVIFNTDKHFAWLPQYLEDVWSANNWLPSTSATTAYYRRKIIEPYAEQMSTVPNLAKHMCGDFSLRGHTSLQAGCISGAAHLAVFDRTATIGSNALLKKYYGADLFEEVPGMGTPSLEHSVVEQGIAWFKHRIMNGDIPEYMYLYLKKAAMDGNWEINLLAEMCFILYLITEVQPTGMMTYVSDTYDYWSVVSKILPVIKDAILNRSGCFSVRPDSGNPVHIICGDPALQDCDVFSDNYDKPERLGTLHMLFKIFGGETNEKGFMVLPPQIRMIYGDAITPEITKSVCEWCLEQRISIENLAFGIGAYTYQYVTRDTRGYAIKATDCIHEDFGEMPIYKQPKTDPGKKSPRGCVAVVKDPIHQNYMLVDGLTLEASLKFPGNIMVKKFQDGEMFNQETISQIRERLDHEED